MCFFQIFQKRHFYVILIKYSSFRFPMFVSYIQTGNVTIMYIQVIYNLMSLLKRRFILIYIHNDVNSIRNNTINND